MIRTFLIAALPLLGATQAAAPDASTQARDHESILAMAGTYKVSFDMRETVSFVPGYTLLPAKISGGHEVVRAIVDTPDHIVLQHILVVDTGEAKPAVVKHWRQDWTWQPKDVLVYSAPGAWTLLPVTEAERKGAWSQTVWQTDDSPRYGAVGRWRYDDGVARWTSVETRRPLARRDAVRSPPYDHYMGTNRHALTPGGWVHEQDNAKIGTKGGRGTTFAHEILLNTYTTTNDFPVSAADTYWTRTKAYWATVRADWDRIIAQGKGVRVREEAENGTQIGHELMLLADDIVSGEQSEQDAIREAAALIDKETARAQDR